LDMFNFFNPCYLMVSIQCINGDKLKFFLTFIKNIFKKFFTRGVRLYLLPFAG
jgi:hypothetical protein